MQIESAVSRCFKSWLSLVFPEMVLILIKVKKFPAVMILQQDSRKKETLDANGTITLKL